MRILILTTYYTPDTAANGIIISQLAEGLAQAGHRVSVVTTMPHYSTNSIWPEYRRKLWQKEGGGNLRIFRVYLYVPSEKGRVLRRVLSYFSFNLLSGIASCLMGRPDVVFVPSPPLTNGVEGFLLSRLLRAPFIYNVQDIYPDVAVRLGILKSRRAIRFFQRMERFVYRKAAAVSILSEGFRRNLQQKGVPDAKLHIIPNFVDTGFITPQPRCNAFSAEHGLNDRFVLLFAGNVGMSQGLGKVLEAAKLLEAQEEIQFLIVGNGTASPQLQEMAANMQLRNVRFLPYQPFEILPAMYATADVCLVPLRKGVAQESVPSKVYTILGAGKPLIAAVDADSDTAALIREAGCGLLVEPENPEALAGAIRFLAADRDKAACMGSNGRAYVETRFSCERIVQQYEALFQQVAARR